MIQSIHMALKTKSASLKSLIYNKQPVDQHSIYIKNLLTNNRKEKDTVVREPCAHDCEVDQVMAKSHTFEQV